MSGQRPASSTTNGALLKGRWKFQLREQTIRLPSGEVAEVIRQELSQAGERFLTITDHELTTTHEYDADGVAALGRKYYEVTCEYYREGDRLLVTPRLVMPIPDLAPMPMVIQELDSHKLILAFVFTATAPGWPVTEVVTHYIR